MQKILTEFLALGTTSAWQGIKLITVLAECFPSIRETIDSFVMFFLILSGLIILMATLSEYVTKSADRLIGDLDFKDLEERFADGQ